MSDIAKARYFLKHRDSKLDHLETFGLMLTTAKTNYSEIKFRGRGDDQGVDFEQNELAAMIDLAVLSYLKKYARLPDDVTKVLLPAASDEEKRNLAMGWYSA